jgi:hypothetical protein
MNYFKNVGYRVVLEKLIIEVEKSGEGMLEGYVRSFKEYFKGREGTLINIKEYENWSSEKIEGVIDDYDYGGYKTWNWYDCLFGIDIEDFDFEDYYEECCERGMGEEWSNEFEELSFEMFLIDNYNK